METKKVCMLLEGIYGEIYYRFTSYAIVSPMMGLSESCMGRRLFGPNIIRDLPLRNKIFFIQVSLMSSKKEKRGRGGGGRRGKNLNLP